jgi:hypothetical protein
MRATPQSLVPFAASEPRSPCHEFDRETSRHDSLAQSRCTPYTRMKNESLAGRAGIYTTQTTLSRDITAWVLIKHDGRYTFWPTPCRRPGRSPHICKIAFWKLKPRDVPRRHSHQHRRSRRGRPANRSRELGRKRSDRRRRRHGFHRLQRSDGSGPLMQRLRDIAPVAFS